MKGCFKLCLLLVIGYFTSKFCYDKTDGFILSKIYPRTPIETHWEVSNPPFEEAFKQTFTYLNAGGQCYAFVSEDQKYVLKFFKHHLRQLPFFLHYLPLPGQLAKKKEEKKLFREKKLKRDFTSYAIASQELQKESGLLFVHLTPTHTLHTRLTIVDKIGISHQIDLDQVGFLLQKKAELAYPYLSYLIESQQIGKAKQAVESICHLIKSRCQKGIYDEDAKIHRNFGFIDNQAMLIDIGRLRYDKTRLQKEVQQADLLKIITPFHHYLETISPEVATYLSQCIKN